MQVNQAESYQLICLAGDGGQAQTYLAERQSQKYVIKIYNSHHQTFSYPREVRMLSLFHSPHIIRMIEHFPQGRLRIRGELQTRSMIVLELLEHGDLFKLVNMGRFSEDVSRTLFKQLLQALKALKEVQIAHLDIKLENILLDQNYCLKLSDFGLAKNLAEEPEYLTTKQGTPSYFAPEIHEGKYRGYEVDIFAAGVVLFLMVFRTPPFQNTLPFNPDYNLIRKGKLQLFWKRFQKIYPASMPLKRLLSRIFSADPSVRPRLSQLESEQWLLGPILSQDQMRKYMEPRYRRLQKNDEETRNIRIALRSRLANLIQRENDKADRSRSRQKNSHRFVEQDSVVSNTDLDLNINEVEELKYNGHYAKILPKMVILWLEELVAQTKLAKTSWIDSAEGAQISAYHIEVKEKGIFQLMLEYLLRGDDVSWKTEVILEGRLVSWQGGVGVIWAKKEGSDFWASQIKAKLQEEFELTFE